MSSSTHKHIIIIMASLLSLIPVDVLAVAVLQLLDAVDVAGVATAVGKDVLFGEKLLHPSAAATVFVAKRVLDGKELDWFREVGVRVVLLAERLVIPFRLTTTDHKDFRHQCCTVNLYHRTDAAYPIQVWMLNGMLHRIDGPAVEQSNGARSWWRNGKLHRDDDQPAVEPAHTIEPSNDGYIVLRNMPAIVTANEIIGNNIVRVDDRREWWFNGERHRDNGLPAFERANGNRQWWVHGKQHRDHDLPAIERVDGYCEWVVNGIRHRDGGPAVIRADGGEMWMVHGEYHRVGGLPAVTNGEGSNEYYENGKLHRANGLPAVDVNYGHYQEWWVCGKLHRDGGEPSIEWTKGHKLWWRHGEDTFYSYGRERDEL